MNEIFNEKLINLRKELGKSRLEGEKGFLQKLLEDKLLERFAESQRRFDKALAFGDEALSVINFLHEDKKIKKITYSEENSDLILSCGVLHRINNVPDHLINAYRLLRQDGVFMANFFGGISLNELRACLNEAEIQVLSGATPRVWPFIEIKTIGALMQSAGFNSPIADSDRVVLHYNDIYGLIKDLRDLGETNALIKGKKPLKKGIMEKAGEIYKNKFSDGEGGIKLPWK